MHMEKFYQPPEWSAGHISLDDAGFLDDLVDKLRPRKAIEIGVASGCSSAVLLRALCRNHSSAVLYSFDIATHCYFSGAYPVGAAVATMALACLKNWCLNLGQTSIDAGCHLSGQEIPLAFIDGNHKHPWPTLDLLAMLPALASTACIALHDISAAENQGKFLGANWLYKHWPYVKEEHDNIGVIYLPDNHALVREICFQLLMRPWQAPVARFFLDGLMQHGHTVMDLSMQRFISKISSITGEHRKIWIWGAGSSGLILRESLLAAGLHVTGCVDSDIHLQQKSNEDLLIKPPARLLNENPKPIALVASSAHKEIAPELAGADFIENADFFVLNNEYGP